MKNHKLPSVIALISLILAIIIKLIASALKTDFTVPDNIIIGIVIYIALTVWDLSASHKDLHKKQTKLFEHWKTNEEIDKIINNIRADFHKIVHHSYGKKDLFESHFHNELKSLERKIKDVAENKELSISANHFLNADNVLDAFADDEDKVWFYTWPIEDGNSQLFDPLHWSQYFEKTAKMVQDGGIKKIKAILVLKDETLLKSPRIEKLLHFFSKTKNIECRIITFDNFQQICASDNFNTNQKDWGLYGKRFLYINEQYDPEIKGTFTKDTNKIERYYKLFETMWNLDSVTIENPSKEREELSLSDLFSFDKNCKAI